MGNPAATISMRNMSFNTCMVLRQSAKRIFLNESVPLATKSNASVGQIHSLPSLLSHRASLI